MVTDAGLPVKTHEEDTDDGYRITIEIPKINQGVINNYGNRNCTR